MTKQEKNDLKVELKSRKIIKKKLETAIRDLSRTIDRIQNDRLNRIEQLSQYKTKTISPTLMAGDLSPNPNTTRCSHRCERAGRK